MDPLKPLVRHLTHDLYLRRDGYRLGRLRVELARSQFLSEDEIRARQLARLKELVAFAWRENEFYRRRFQDHGFEPGDLRELSDLARLPVLTKDEVRRELVGSLSRGYTRETTLHKRTGGSTGVPLHCFLDHPAAAFKKAATERHNAWAGLVPGERLAALWGDTEKPLPWKERMRNRLTDRAVFLDTLRFEPGRIEAFLGRVRRLRPPVLLGHAHSIYQLARYARARSIADLPFRSIITTAMVLSEGERREIEEVFGAPVFNRYGCEELSLIASECPAHDGLHILAEGLYVELAGEDGPGPRPLVITDLVNRAMPFLRYEIGDLAIAAEGRCPCGRGLPRLREVCGRAADFLYTPDGIPVFGISILDTFTIHLPGIKQAQIVQDHYDHLDFHVVRDEGFSEESLARLRGDVRRIFGERMRYDVHFTDAIPQTERGKYRFSICRIEGRGPDSPG